MDARETLAEVRRWLCDHLSAGDAGKICGMLSAVSRRLAEADELEEENARLRDENEILRTDRDMYHELYQMAYCPSHFSQVKAENARLRNEWESERDYANQMEAIAKKKQAENAELRELARDLRLDERCEELGIEVSK